MHLLLAQRGTIAESDDPVDLGQSPASLLFLSAADTDIAALAGARQRLGTGAPQMRAANLMQLLHPMSVDTWIERTAQHAQAIVVRLLGGARYWDYGVEALRSLAMRKGIALVLLSGDDKPDAELQRLSTVSALEHGALHAYWSEGGADNADGFLRFCAALLDGSEKPAAATPLMKVGVLPVANHRAGERPVAAVIFYRALMQSAQTHAIEALCRSLSEQGFCPMPVYVSSLKDTVCAATVGQLFARHAPAVVLNTTGFALSAPGAVHTPTVLDALGVPVLQVVLSTSSREAWASSSPGLNPRDLAMNVALPEIDGRVLTRAVSFKAAALYDTDLQTNIVMPQADGERCDFVARLAANWVRLARTPASEKRVAVILANYPNKDGRLANGVGLDTPAGTVEVLRAMQASGFDVGELPADGDALIADLRRGPTNAAGAVREVRETLSLSEYKAFLHLLPRENQAALTERWGAPEDDPFFRDGVFALPLSRMGNCFVGVQPARGYNIDPKESYHSPDLVPPHGYLAFHAFLRLKADVHAVIHMGKHGNLEWLPGKALALSASCWPELALGPMPNIYPFIVNDPGEGTQAKRRTSAVIIDHLTPPLTRAENHGALADLERLVDEYYDASGGDRRRLSQLRIRILDLVRDVGLDQDAGINAADDTDAALQKIDAYLCDLKEMQIRDGLHIFGRAPEGRLLDDLVVALARLGSDAVESLHRAIAADGLVESPSSSPSPRNRGEGGADAGVWVSSPRERGEDGGSQVRGDDKFDPLDCDFAAHWTGPKPDILQSLSSDPWRTQGDTVERIELLASALVSGATACPAGWVRTAKVLQGVNDWIRPSVIACGNAEISGIMAALAGKFVAPGPSGAPTRGRPDVLPTGRNFYSVDCRAVPTEAAWALGKKSAELLVTRHCQDHGDWPKAMALTAWGTSNMRTGGDDIAQALALIGAKPLWDRTSGRVTGYEVITLAELGRPRVDVTLRISGFFRDAFPDQIVLFDKAVRAVGALDEDESDNPIAARIASESDKLIAQGVSATEAARRAGYRVFGSKPGAYGAGLQALIDEGGWASRDDLAEAYLVWGSYAYGSAGEGTAERGLFEERLSRVEAVVQNQDNREHDLLDSDDYYQFEGGMSAAVEKLSGARPVIYHNDHSRPERPTIRTLEEEIGRVVRARVTNPKWIAGVMRHGYKGAFEIAATVDYLFAFSATTGAVRDHHFEAVYQAFIMDEEVRDFIADKNPDALRDIAARLREAIDRGLWTAKSNSAQFDLEIQLSHK
jgi:cobaltochelatase CobN